MSDSLYFSRGVKLFCGLPRIQNRLRKAMLLNETTYDIFKLKFESIFKVEATGDI